MDRRDFLKISSLSVLNFLFSRKDVFASKNRLEQRVNVNLPAYSLTLTNFLGRNLEETFIFPIGIGKGHGGRRQTPIGRGFIYDKRKEITFRYGADYPNIKIKKGDIIKWTNTYDEHGKPKGYPMPYSQMRGLGMMIKTNLFDYSNNFVIHSTTDEFTIGTPTSSGCLRVGMEDMLNLYDRISPSTIQGDLKKIVPIKISYNLIELDQETIKLHANVYNKNIDIIQEFKEKITETDFNQEDFDYNKMKKAFTSANRKFRITHKRILKVLSKHHPHNFVPLYLKENLHKTYKTYNFLR